MCHRFGLRRSCETWVGDVKVLWCLFGPFGFLGVPGAVGPHFGSLGAPWGALGPHFRSLGALLGPLGKPFWPKLAQVGQG